MNVYSPDVVRPATNAAVFPVAPGVYGLRILFVNVYLITLPQEQGWVLVDCGLAGFDDKIRDAARAILGGTYQPPRAIILTHGHFDHIGTLDAFLDEDDSLLAYAHPLEHPYLTGKSAYPPPDPTVGRGLMALLAFAYPHHARNFGHRIRALAEDHTLPYLPDWQWLHTPGHAPGHVSLWRPADKTLLAGDAIVTTRQESLSHVIRQKPELNGPPAYFTHDWRLAEESARTIAKLGPEVLASGHGRPMAGTDMRDELDLLVRHFRDVAVPSRGRYVNRPALTGEQGVRSLPPSRVPAPLMAAGVVGLATFLGLWLASRGR